MHFDRQRDGNIKQTVKLQDRRQFMRIQSISGQRMAASIAWMLQMEEWCGILKPMDQLPGRRFYSATCCMLVQLIISCMHLKSDGFASDGFQINDKIIWIA
jgi:hypothetical protein